LLRRAGSKVRAAKCNLHSTDVPSRFRDGSDRAPELYRAIPVRTGHREASGGGGPRIRQAYARSFVERVGVDRDTIKVSGPKEALTGSFRAGVPENVGEVLTSVREWRPVDERDENLWTLTIARPDIGAKRNA
jgi:hypothetical protein